MEKEFIVVPVMNDRTYKWGVRQKADDKTPQWVLPMLGKFRDKALAALFAAAANNGQGAA